MYGYAGSAGGGGFAILVLLIFFTIVAIFGGKKTYHIRFKHLCWTITKFCPQCLEYTLFKRLSGWKKYWIISLILLLITKGTWLLFMHIPLEVGH